MLLCRATLQACRASLLEDFGVLSHKTTQEFRNDTGPGSPMVSGTQRETELQRERNSDERGELTLAAASVSSCVRVVSSSEFRSLWSPVSHRVARAIGETCSLAHLVSNGAHS